MKVITDKGKVEEIFNLGHVNEIEFGHEIFFNYKDGELCDEIKKDINDGKYGVSWTGTGNRDYKYVLSRNPRPRTMRVSKQLNKCSPYIVVLL